MKLNTFNRPFSLLTACTLTTLAALPAAARGGGGGFDLRDWAFQHAMDDGGAACLAGRFDAFGLAASDATPDRSLFVDPITGRNLLNYPPHRVVDFTNMKLDIRIADMNTPKFDATQVLSFTPIAEELSDLILDAKRLTITSVSAKGSKTSFKTDGLKLSISFDPPLPMGKSADLTITYSVNNPPEGLFWAPESPAWPGRPAQIHTQGEPETNSFWFPCHDFPNDKLTTELSVTVPRGYVVSSNGRFEGKINSITPVPDAFGKTTLKPFETWRWAQDDSAGGPHTNYLVSLIVGKFDIVDVANHNVEAPSSTGLPRPRGYTSPLLPLLGKAYSKPGLSIEMPVYVPQGRGGDVLQSYGRTAEMIRFFSALFDQPYAWAKYSQLVVHNFAFGGMENTSATTMFDTAVLSKDALVDHELDGLISHELGHQWFGDLITGNSWEHVWLNEGFATYLTSLWFEHRDGEDAYQTAIQGTFDGVIGGDRGKAPETPAMVSKAYHNPVETLRRSANPYSKGASILHMLRRKLGDEVFFTSLRTYVNRFARKTAETDDLRKVFEEVSGESLERFFTQWAKRPGIPRLKIAAHYADSKLTLDLSQTQPIDSYNPAFVFDLPVSVKTAGGKTLTKVWNIDSKDQTLSFDLPQAPASIAIDPDLFVVAEFSLDEPTDWLVNQLKGGPTLASKFQAARTLASRNEPGVIAALSSIATSSSENRQLRIESIRALDALGQAETLAGIAQNTKTDVNVRIPALDALTAVATRSGAAPASHELAAGACEKALTDSTSVRLRASAAHGLAALKSSADESRVLALAARGSANDSQHDVMRQTIADSLPSFDDDKALAVALDLSKPGINSRTRASAISAVAKLAKHDTKGVLAALGTYLADPEIRARRAAINGLAELGTPDAIALLKARIDNVPSPYEHDDIAKVIKDAEAKVKP